MPLQADQLNSLWHGQAMLQAGRQIGKIGLSSPEVQDFEITLQTKNFWL
jgi:hypothetical protein